MSSPTIGTRFSVRRAVLEDNANIEEAFEYFYLGADADYGLEHFLSDHEDRLIDVETAVAGVGVTSFNDLDFRVYKNGASSSKIKFNLSALTTERVVTVLDTDQTLVNLDSIQTLTNKTLAQASTVIGVKDSTFTLYDAGLTGKNAKFSNTSLPVGTTVLSFPALTGNDTFVFQDMAQTLKYKTFQGYKEVATTLPAVNVDLYNAATLLNLAAPTTISFTGTLPSSPSVYTCSFLFTGSANLTWPAGIKWAGGAALATVSSIAMAVLTYYNGTWYGVNMGIFS